MTNALQVDSLIANEFAFEINGEVISGIFGISDLVTYASNENGGRIKPPFKVTKMVERDGNKAFNKWLRETTAARDSADKPSRDVTVVAVDDGVETRRWTAKGAWIMSISYTAFDSGSSDMIAETFLIGYEDIEETWPATANLE